MAVFSQVDPSTTWAPLGDEYICVNDVEYPPDWNVVRQIRREFDPFFVPALVRQPWSTGTGEVVVIVHHIICRQVPDPKTEVARIDPLPIHLPTHTVLGRRLRHPIIAGHTLDGKSPDESGNGLPGYYVPFDERVLASMRAIQWIHRNEGPVAAREAQVAEKQIGKLANRKTRRAVIADEFEFKKPKVYVSSTLTKLRAAAGAAA